jgi:hypothetical protein
MPCKDTDDVCNITRKDVVCLMSVGLALKGPTRVLAAGSYTLRKLSNVVMCTQHMIALTQGTVLRE